MCFKENDRGDDSSAGEAHSGGSSPHHTATGRAQSLRWLGKQDGAHWGLADTNHTHCQVLTLVHWLCAIFIWFYTWILNFETFLSLSLSPPSSRGCHEALSALEIPNDLLQVIQDLLLDLRVHCLMMTLLHTTEGEAGLKSKKSNGGRSV